MKNYKVIATWHDGGAHRQIAGTYKTIEQAHKKQMDTVNQIPISALEEHISITIETIKHRK